MRKYDKIDNYIINTTDDETRLLISDFAILWNKYENYFFHKEYRPRFIDDNVIDKLMKIESREDEINELFGMLTEYLKEKIIVIDGEIFFRYFYFRKSDIVIEGNTDDAIKIVEHLLHTSNYKERLKLMLLITGRVRNNMFHGLKEIENLKDQKKLFSLCNQIMKMVIDAGNINLKYQ